MRWREPRWRARGQGDVAHLLQDAAPGGRPPGVLSAASRALIRKNSSAKFLRFDATFRETGRLVHLDRVHVDAGLAMFF